MSSNDSSLVNPPGYYESNFDEPLDSASNYANKERPSLSDSKVDPASIPTTTFTFLPAEPNAMVLVPPANAADPRPVYHISWSEDFFMPGNVVTQVRRGGSHNGPLVGEFNLKMFSPAATVRVGSSPERWLEEVYPIRTPGRYTKWHYSTDNKGSPVLYWFRFLNFKTCLLGSPRGEQIAKYTWPNYARRDRSLQVATLTLNSVGQIPEIFDELVLSALISERNRTRP
ncbi:hypothetical protein EIP91_004551 [Steccherinum ochraceum]|uniref:DUF6593 domain-containing protein n=1 Tax=Steccherinum ochraceum TaxID=92696 RepID=A0A4R0RH28_9APHY|nr:hypothetical protein EIP91_004551 [Steccherinum ochraceum]